MSASNKAAESFASIEEKKEAYAARNMIIKARKDPSRIKYNKLSARLQKLRDEHARLAAEDEAIRRDAVLIQNSKNRSKEIELRMLEIEHEIMGNEDKKGLIHELTTIENDYGEGSSNPNPCVFWTDSELKEALKGANEFCGFSLNDTQIREVKETKEKKNLLSGIRATIGAIFSFSPSAVPLVKEKIVPTNASDKMDIISNRDKVILTSEQQSDDIDWMEMQSEIGKIQDMNAREAIREKIHPLMDVKEKKVLLKEVHALVDMEKKPAEILVLDTKDKPIEKAHAEAVSIAHTQTQSESVSQDKIDLPTQKRVHSSNDGKQPAKAVPKHKTKEAEAEKDFRARILTLVDIVLDKVISLSPNLSLQFFSDFVVLPDKKENEVLTLKNTIVSHAKNFFGFHSIGSNLAGVAVTIVPEPVQGLQNTISAFSSTPGITAGGR